MFFGRNNRDDAGDNAERRDMADEIKEANTAVAEPSLTQESSPETQESHEKRGPTGWIPKERFQEVIDQRREKEAELEREREHRIRLEEQLKAKETPTTPTKTQPTYSRADLQKLVEEGRITQTDADAYMDDLIEQRAVQRARSEIDAKLTESQKFSTVQSRLNEYVSLMPGLRQPSSEEFKRAAQEYAFLVDLEGLPKTELQKRTMELKAVRMAYGDVSTIKARTASSTTTPEREVPMETHSSNHRPPSVNGRDPIKDLTPAQKAHYEKMFMKSNDYPNGWEDVRKELLWQRPSLTRKTR